MKKQLWSLAQFGLPGLGFMLICAGAYLVSLQSEDGNTWRVILAYIMMALGFVAVLIGVFWIMCHSMKSKMYQRRPHEQRIHVYAIARPSSFPPSYMESQGSQMRLDAAPELVVMVDSEDVVLSLAPPLYSQDSLEAPDCTWSFEQPPRYSQVERIQQGKVDAGERREALSTH